VSSRLNSTVLHRVYPQWTKIGIKKKKVKTDFVGRLSAQTMVATYMDIHTAIRNPQPYKDAVEHFKRLDRLEI
jgi:hypothetical protein